MIGVLLNSLVNLPSWTVVAYISAILLNSVK